MSKGSVYLNIPIIGRVITIWDELFCKLRESVYGPVTRKKVFYKYSHRIDTHIDLIVEFIKVHSCVSFELCLDEELIEYC